MKIAEAYVHLKIEPSKNFRKAAKSYLRYHGDILSKEILGEELQIVVKVKEDSFIAWVTAVGALVYFGVVSYGSFRSGIDHIVKDARRFGQALISLFLRESDVPNERVFRVERRLGVPGKIQRIFKRIDRLERQFRQAVSEDVRSELEKIKEDIIKVFELMESEQDRQLFLNSLPESIRDVLQEQLPHPRDDITESYLPEEDTEDEALPDPVRRLPPPQ